MPPTRSIRSTASRETTRLSLPSRRSSLGSNHDAFSDDHALDWPVSSDDPPFNGFPAPRHPYPDHVPPLSAPAIVSPFADPLMPDADRTSTTKPQFASDEMPATTSSSHALLGRSPSVSTASTMTRSHSPYNGPTAPSHPYAMYPQMTRASSMASDSTIRPGSDTLFGPAAGPQHPYALYPQNTVPEEDEDITANGIPLGFPRANFQSSSGGSSSDMGDIIGSDGHIEHLPPYTRYADNTVAKGNMDDINERRRSQGTTAPSADAVTNAAPPSTVDSTTLLHPTGELAQETEAQRARKEGYRGTWKDTAMRPTIAGMPLWGLILVIVIVIFAAIIGGVVGGVIGNRQGAQRAYANGAMTTVWLDAMPTTLGPGASPLPTGHFQISFNQSYEINNCIPNKDVMGSAWGCMDIAYIGVNVFLDSASGTTQAALEDFSVNTMDFKYGPQPPDFNGTSFTLHPMVDKDADGMGVAMFFSVLFDKLSIIPEDALQKTPGKRELDAGQFDRRSPALYDGSPLKPSDRPWFCFWNSTINEFFIYVDEDAPSSSFSTEHKVPDPTAKSPPVTTPVSLPDMSSGVPSQAWTMASPAPTQSSTTFQAYNPTYGGLKSTPTARQRRGYEMSSPNMSNYPKLIKMVEKRKPADPNSVHVQPYCQMMQVLDNWDIVPIPTVETLCIEEIQYTTSTSTSRYTGPPRPRERRDVVSDLESFCICEWIGQ